MFLLRGLPVADGAGVLYEYASIALADMYSTELAGVNTGWADISEGGSGGGRIQNGQYRNWVWVSSGPGIHP
jgi:hypothetical protein